MGNQKSANDSTEIKEQVEAERLARELATKRAALEEAEREHAALERRARAADERAKQALIAAQETETERLARQRTAELQAERAQALEAFTRARQEAHDALFARCAEMAEQRSKFVQASRELGITDRFEVATLPLGYSIDSALDGYLSLKQREADRERLALRAREKAAR